MLRKLLIRIVAALLITFALLAGAEVFLRLQHFVQLDHFHDQKPWNRVLHHGSGTFTVDEYGAAGAGPEIKLLLLGDSWMEDPVLGSSIGRELARQTGRPVRSVNGGNSSYAPTLYMLKGRKAFEKFGKFDCIVVNIDETDVGDEWVRYRIPTVRDSSGRISAVSFNRDLHSEFLWHGKLWAEDSPLYLVRLVKFAFYYKVLVPMLYELTYCPDYPTLMQYLYAPDSRTRFARELKHFDGRLLEMAEELASYTGGPATVYVTHHPHRGDLAGLEEDGHSYLPIVSEALTRLGQEAGVTVLDATASVDQIHGARLKDGTFEPGDTFSHLQTDGTSRYGDWIARQIASVKDSLDR